MDFFRSEFSLWRNGRLIRLPLPLRTTYQGSAQGRMIFIIKEDWKGFGAGSVVALRRDDPGGAPELVFAPGPRQAVQEVRVTAGRVVINLLDDVKYQDGDGFTGWLAFWKEFGFFGVSPPPIPL